MNVSASEWLALALSAVVLWAAGKVIVTCYRGGYDDLEDIKYVVLDGYEEDLWEGAPSGRRGGSRDRRSWKGCDPMNPRDYNRLRRRVSLVYIVTSSLYILMGILLSCQAYAQTRITTYINAVPVRQVPTGHTSAVVQDYYNYLWLRNLAQFTETYINNPRILSWIYGILAGAIILMYFLIFAWYTRFKSRDLYPVEVYNGYVSERANPVDPFTWAVSAIIVGYGAYYITINLIFGQYY